MASHEGSFKSVARRSFNKSSLKICIYTVIHKGLGTNNLQVYNLDDPNVPGTMNQLRIIIGARFFLFVVQLHVYYDQP